MAAGPSAVGLAVFSSALPPTEAVELAVGMLTEKLYCPEPAMKFYKCFVDSGRSDAYSAAQDVCKKEHEGLMECVRERDINDVCQRYPLPE